MPAKPRILKEMPERRLLSPKERYRKLVVMARLGNEQAESILHRIIGERTKGSTNLVLDARQENASAKERLERNIAQTAKGRTSFEEIYKGVLSEAETRLLKSFFDEDKFLPATVFLKNFSKTLPKKIQDGIRSKDKKTKKEAVRILRDAIETKIRGTVKKVVAKFCQERGIKIPEKAIDAVIAIIPKQPQIVRSIFFEGNFQLLEKIVRITAKSIRSLEIAINRDKNASLKRIEILDEPARSRIRRWFLAEQKNRVAKSIINPEENYRFDADLNERILKNIGITEKVIQAINLLPNQKTRLDAYVAVFEEVLREMPDVPDEKLNEQISKNMKERLEKEFGIIIKSPQKAMQKTQASIPEIKSQIPNLRKSAETKQAQVKEKEKQAEDRSKIIDKFFAGLKKRGMRPEYIPRIQKILGLIERQIKRKLSREELQKISAQFEPGTLDDRNDLRIAQRLAEILKN